MLDQLKSEIRARLSGARPRLRRAGVFALQHLRSLWSVVRPPLLFALQVIAALVVLFEEWGWRPLSEALAQLSRYRPWAALERWIAGLPPTAALLVFALPTTILIPLKLVAVWLLARGAVWSAGALFVGAKLASTALIARIFMLTKPALMQIGWFARAYNWFTPWKEAIFAWIRESFAWRYGRMVKNRIRLEAKQAWARWKPRLVAEWQKWRPWLAERAARLSALLSQSLAQWTPRLRQEARRLGALIRAGWNRMRGFSR
jgi:hypothetical protein